MTLIGQVWVMSLLLESGRGWNHSTCNTWAESGGESYKGKQGHGYQGVGQWLLVRPKPRVPALEVRLTRTKKSLLGLKENGLDMSQLPFTQIRSAPFIAWEAGPPGLHHLGLFVIQLLVGFGQWEPRLEIQETGRRETGGVSSLLLLLCHHVPTRGFIFCSREDVSPPRCGCHWLLDTVLSPGPVRPFIEISLWGEFSFLPGVEE